MRSLEKSRFELVLTRWDDGIFKSLDRIEATNTESLVEQLNVLIFQLQVKMQKEIENRQELDDDIPF